MDTGDLRNLQSDATRASLLHNTDHEKAAHVLGLALTFYDLGDLSLRQAISHIRLAHRILTTDRGPR